MLLLFGGLVGLAVVAFGIWVVWAILSAIIWPVVSTIVEIVLGLFLAVAVLWRESR